MRSTRDRIVGTASRLLGNQRVFGGVQRALRESQNARRAVERTLGRILAATNLPSQQEVERLYDHLRELEREVADMTRRVNEIGDKLSTLAR